MNPQKKINFGISRAEFHSTYICQKPFLFRNSIKTKDISWRQISEVYERADSADRSFKLMHGREIPKHEYIESYFNVGKIEHRYIKPVIYKHMRNGATLVYNRIRNEPFINNISHQIAQFSGAQVITSGYAAFSATPSYRCHWDTRDVFAVQLKGRKRWILKEPNFQLPLYMQQSKDLPHIEEPEEVYCDITLEAGDILYVPRGWWHNPIPLGDETFHLAVGTFAPTGFEYLNWLVNLSPNMTAARQNLHSYKEDTETLAQLGQELKELISSKDIFESFMAHHIGQHRTDSTISLDKLANKKSASQLEENLQVRLNACLLYRFTESFLIVNGNRITTDEESFGLIQYLHTAGSCPVADIVRSFPECSPQKVKELLFNLAMNDIIDIL